MVRKREHRRTSVHPARARRRAARPRSTPTRRGGPAPGNHDQAPTRGDHRCARAGRPARRVGNAGHRPDRRGQSATRPPAGPGLLRTSFAGRTLIDSKVAKGAGDSYSLSGPTAPRSGRRPASAWARHTRSTRASTGGRATVPVSTQRRTTRRGGLDSTREAQTLAGPHDEDLDHENLRWAASRAP